MMMNACLGLLLAALASVTYAGWKEPYRPYFLPGSYFYKHSWHNIKNNIVEKFDLERPIINNESKGIMENLAIPLGAHPTCWQTFSLDCDFVEISGNESALTSVYDYCNNQNKPIRLTLKAPTQVAAHEAADEALKEAQDTLVQVSKILKGVVGMIELSTNRFMDSSRNYCKFPRGTSEMNDTDATRGLTALDLAHWGWNDQLMRDLKACIVKMYATAVKAGGDFEHLQSYIKRLACDVITADFSVFEGVPSETEYYDAIADRIATDPDYNHPHITFD